MFGRKKQAPRVPTPAPSAESLKDMSLFLLAGELSMAVTNLHFHRQDLERARSDKLQYGTSYPVPPPFSDYQGIIDRVMAEFHRRDMEALKEGSSRCPRLVNM